MSVELMARLVRPAAQNIGVALSGGGDSVALLHLLRLAGHEVHAVTVDHGLRPESADEALKVAGWCGEWGVTHDILRWEDHATSGNLMEAASKARIALIGAWAKGQGLSAVALGHTADDQAECLLIGLSRAAGIDGLCGLRPDWQERGIHWSRPMLQLTRAELRDWLMAQGLPWIDDPSNTNDRFLRARIRKALAGLAPLGLTPERLATSATHLASARQALDAAVAEAADRVMVERAGALQVDAEAFAALPEEIARRLAQAAILWLTGAEYAPRAADLARFIGAIVAGASATLAGCRLKQGWLTVEPRLANLDRWQIEGQGSSRLMGAEGLRQTPDWRDHGLPRHVLELTPGLWQGEILLSAPSMGGLGRAECVPSFKAFVLSH